MLMLTIDRNLKKRTKMILIQGRIQIYSNLIKHVEIYNTFEWLPQEGRIDRTIKPR